jgi:hypothetical protein
MASNTKISFSKYTKGVGCPNEGCLIPLSGTSGLWQHFPSNTNHLFLVINGNIRTEYQDGAVQTHTNPYSNTWSSYVDPWIYDKPVQAYTRSDDDIFVRVSLINTTFSQITFSAAKIVNEEITKTTNKRSFLYVYGSEFSYKKDNVEITPETSGMSFGYGQMAGNTLTHSITANSSPVTVIFIEEN